MTLEEIIESSGNPTEFVKVLSEECGYPRGTVEFVLKALDSKETCFSVIKESLYLGLTAIQLLELDLEDDGIVIEQEGLLSAPLIEFLLKDVFLEDTDDFIRLAEKLHGNSSVTYSLSGNGTISSSSGGLVSMGELIERIVSSNTIMDVFDSRLSSSTPTYKEVMVKQFVDIINRRWCNRPHTEFKIVWTDNYNRDNVADFLVCTGIHSVRDGKIMLEALRQKAGDGDWYLLVPDWYQLKEVDY